MELLDNYQMETYNALNEVGHRASVPDVPLFMIYKSLDEAKANCNFWFDVDITHPEATCPHLTIQQVGQQKLRKETIQIVKISLKQLVDIRDYSTVQLWIVCKGQAVVVQTPSVPRWMLDEDVHQLSALNFHHGSARLLEGHKTAFNDIARDASRIVHTTLLVFPDNVHCTRQITFPACIDGKQVKPKPHELVVDIPFGGGNQTHILRPISWVMRNVIKPRE